MNRLKKYIGSKSVPVIIGIAIVVIVSLVVLFYVGCFTFGMFIFGTDIFFQGNTHTLILKTIQIT